MKILLLGEYSNVHATLEKALRGMGHQVTLVSNGDFWKNYPRDIDLSRREGKIGGIRYLLHLAALLPRMTGYDVVQLINPMFLEIKASRIFPVYDFLRKHNGKMFLGAFGMDYYWVKGCCGRKHLKYSDFNIESYLRNDDTALGYRREWTHTDKERLNRKIAADCDGIIAGLYEYWTCYRPEFPRKTAYIPFPMACPDISAPPVHSPVRVFIGINKTRNAYKGTDIMLQAAEDLQNEYPTRMKLMKAISLPFSVYRKMMNGADILLDQLYSYTPSMNTLEAMSKGIVCIGGAEDDYYRFIGENKLRPVVNVYPTYQDVYDKLKHLVLHPEMLPRLKAESIAFVQKHHNCRDVAQQYINFWTSTHPL